MSSWAGSSVVSRTGLDNSFVRCHHWTNIVTALHWLWNRKSHENHSRAHLLFRWLWTAFPKTQRAAKNATQLPLPLFFHALPDLSTFRVSSCDRHLSLSRGYPESQGLPPPSDQCCTSRFERCGWVTAVFFEKEMVAAQTPEKPHWPFWEHIRGHPPDRCTPKRFDIVVSPLLDKTVRKSAFKKASTRRWRVGQSSLTHSLSFSLPFL